MVSNPPENPLGDLQIHQFTPPGSTSKSTMNQAGPSKRKAAATSSSQQPDSYATRRKDAQARLANMIATLDAAFQPPPTLSIPTPKTVSSSSLKFAAIDVWIHVVGCLLASPPSNFDYVAAAKEDAKYQSSKPIGQFRQPSIDMYPYLRCILCMLNGDWKVWANRPNGLTRAIREHMEKYHADLYHKKCREEGVRLPYTIPDNSIEHTPPEFTKEGLVERIVKWTAVSDQPFSAVDCPEFRNILIYCGQGALKDTDIPHRSKVAQVAYELYLQERASIIAEIQNSRGIVSLTSDLWSDEYLRSFMAVTAHFINATGQMAEYLVAFRKIDGNHSGVNVGRYLFEVIEEIGILDKLGQITLDNATTNNTLMDELAAILNTRGIHFDPEENRVRCFAHVINLAVQEYLKKVAKSATSYRAVLAEHGVTPKPEVLQYIEALESDPVSVVRIVVNACRASGQRRDALREIIVNGNLMGRFKTPDGQVFKLDEHELKGDCPTRWGSTLDMVACFLRLYLAVTEYLLRNHEMGIPVVTHKQYEVLQDIASILSVAASAQQLLSSERTPTLSLALPVYETVISLWSQCGKIFPEHREAIDLALLKIRDYVFRSRRSPVHALAMFVNPSLKLTWIAANGVGEFQEERARAHVENALLQYARKRHNLSIQKIAAAKPADQASQAGQAQARGYRNLLGLSDRIQRADGTASTATVLQAPMHPRPPPPVEPSEEQLTQDLLGVVRAEIAKYEGLGVAEPDAKGDYDIVKECLALRDAFPLVHDLAMDILPAQATSVSSERIFSSSKFTCTRERGRILVTTVEALQVLKHSLKQRRTLDFTSHVVSPGDAIIE